MKAGEWSNLPINNSRPFIIIILKTPTRANPTKHHSKSVLVILRNLNRSIHVLFDILCPSALRINIAVIIKGVKIPSPATINQNSIVSCPVSLLSQT
jgi:hypothetical protein